MQARVLWIAMAFALALLFSACSKGGGIQAICEKVADAEEVADCVAELTREVDQCANKDAIIDCFGGADSENAAEACLATCEAAEESE